MFHRLPPLELIVLQDKVVFDVARFARKRFVPQLSYDDHHKLLSGYDIALLPLAPSFPTAGKNDLKFIEVPRMAWYVLRAPVGSGQ